MPLGHAKIRGGEVRAAAQDDGLATWQKTCRNLGRDRASRLVGGSHAVGEPSKLFDEGARTFRVKIPDLFTQRNGGDEKAEQARGVGDSTRRNDTRSVGALFDVRSGVDLYKRLARFSQTIGRADRNGEGPRAAFARKPHAFDRTRDRSRIGYAEHEGMSRNTRNQIAGELERLNRLHHPSGRV